jgi:allantoinase
MEPGRYGPFKYSPIIDRPPLRWPNGARLAVWVVPNIEFFPLNEKMRGEEPVLPNIFPWSRKDYGNRVAVFRMMDALGKRNIRATVALNSEVCIEHPRIIERGLELGWEFMGHCESNSRSIHTMSAEDEQKAIRGAFATIAKATGTPPRGWLGAGGNESWRTLDNLAATGFTYVADWINDDQPYLMDVGKPPLVSIPYSAEINDASQVNRRNVSGEEFGQMIRRQFDVLHEEGEKTGKVMCIALHPWLTGVPHRIRALTDALDYIASQDAVWFATGSEIVEAYLKASKK